MSLIYNIFLFLLFSFIYSTDLKNNKISDKNKDCKVIEECKICSFNELKSIDECQVTGYKTKIQCIEKNNEVKDFYDSCSENTKINSVYIFLMICIIIFFVSYRYQKTQKDSSLQNLMVKLSILKN